LTTELSVFAVTRDPSADVLPGGGVIVPVAHRPSPFHLTAAEWSDTHELLIKARDVLHEKLAPDGYTIGWNDFPTANQVPKHAHAVAGELALNLDDSNVVVVDDRVRPGSPMFGDG
jgi:hypothetical protein